MALSTKSALSYFGSDSEVAGQLASFLDACSHVTVPFVGGAAILPHLSAKAIVANDLNSLAINFYRVTSGVYGEAAKTHLFERAAATLSHPNEIQWATSVIETHAVTLPLDSTSKADLAWAYWALCWIGRKGKGGTKQMGGNASVRRAPDGGNNATRIRAVASDMHEWAKHFRRCEWECRDFREVLSNCSDREACGIYCDPPWIGVGDSYEHKFIHQDHVELREHLERFAKTTIVLRYGDHPMVRDLYADWNVVESESRTQSNRTTGELWITNKEVVL